MVNDVPVMQATVRPGDRIVLGSFPLLLRRRPVAPAAAGAAAPAPAPAGVEIDELRGLTPGATIIRSQAELDRLIRGAPAEAAPAAGEVERANRILRVLTQVAKALISEDKLEGVLHKVMDLVFENTSAERGVLGLYQGDELLLKVVRYRHPRPAGDRIVIPRAIPNRVRSDRVAILTMDAQSDQRFESSESILNLGIRSAMCVPLWEKERVIGIIYVDEDMKRGVFNANDLDLFAALANYAAVAIERAALTERIKQEEATRAKLERYHSPGVVERILSGGQSLEGMEMQELQATIAFTDVVGFTTMSEGMTPRQVGTTINGLFSELTECVFHHEGTLDKYIGDCIMAVFGAPIAQPDHALRCVRSAVEMHQVLDRLNRGGEHPRLDLRTGINTGSVVAGDIGSPKRKDYSVLGDAVNLAARLESQVAKPGQIVIGEATYAEVKDHFECEYLGTFSLKGKKKEVGAYRVLGEKVTDSTDPQRPSAGRDRPVPSPSSPCRITLPEARTISVPVHPPDGSRMPALRRSWRWPESARSRAGRAVAGGYGAGPRRSRSDWRRRGPGPARARQG
jgi:adenylate cyclase